MKDIKVTPLPLYKNISGKSLFESDDYLFKEYRKRWHEQPLNFIAGDFPLFIDIEVTNGCNLRCSFCATTYSKPGGKKELIHPDVVYKVLDEGKDNGLFGVKFNERGEPLLHPKLIDFIKYAKKCGLVDVYFNTNAMLLTKEKAKELIGSGLDRISISIEGFNAEFYETYRINGKFDLLKKNVKNLWDIRTKSRAKKPLIRIQSVLLPQIQREKDAYLSKYKEFWRHYADEIAIIEYKDEAVSSHGFEPITYPWACHQLWQRMIVWCDGKILPCNEDNLGRMVLGNMHEIGIKDAWNSDYMLKLRKTHKNGDAHSLISCRECFLRNAQVKKLIQEDKIND